MPTHLDIELFSAAYFFQGIGVGFGASAVILAQLMIDLNEIASFRWAIEVSEQQKKLNEQTRSQIKTNESGFEDDSHLKNYGKVINGD